MSAVTVAWHLKVKNWEAEEVKKYRLVFSGPYNVFICQGYNYSQDAIPLPATVTFLVSASEPNLWQGASASHSNSCQCSLPSDFEPNHNADGQKIKPSPM